MISIIKKWNIKIKSIQIIIIYLKTKVIKINQMHILRTFSQRFSTLNAQYLLNKNKSAVRFESQNINWNFQQLNYHGFGLIKGLTSVGLNSNHTFLIKTLPSQQAEAYVAKIGVSGIGAKLIVSKATTEAELDKELRENNVSCFVFEPNVQLQNTKLIDTLNTLASELPSQQLGTPLKLASYPHLKKLIQTNHYSFPGVYKFKAIMNYTSDKYLKVDAAQVQPITIPASNNPIVITDPADDFTFRAGVLNSVVNGRYVHVVEAGNLSQICSQVYGNKCDVISSVETSLAPEVNVIVQKGSQLFSSHKNRIEV